jgi:hypothetical protein
LMHSGIAATDAANAISNGNIADAVASLFRRGVALSLWALIEEMPQIRRLAPRENQRRILAKLTPPGEHYP